MRCDLHVHSWYSSRAEVPVLEHVGRECYSDPLEVYERAVRRGMDLVTLTDHDTIEGALLLAHLPNAFVSEEVTVYLDGGRALHVNVFDLDERRHEALQARRRDLEAFVAFLAEEVITGDITQIDLPPEKVSGPIEAERIIKGINDLRFVYFSEKDVVRHKLVQHIIKAYEKFEKGRSK